MKFNKKNISKEELLALYEAIKLPRLIEDKMLSQLRLGMISKWFSSYGQEAISVGVGMAMEEDEFILPMHRNLGIFTSRNLDLKQLFLQFQGKKDGFTKGRDRSFHFGTKKHHVVGMISHLGPQLGIADGIALANKLEGSPKATIVFSGDGGASEGDFHEALNVATVWDLPVIFCIENNAWGLSTPSREQFRCKQFIDKAIGYGMPKEDAIQIDGNNILEVYSTVKEIAASIRKNPRPIILECMTFRVRGHEEASGTKYYPEGVIDEWSKKDPVALYEEFLLSDKIITPGDVEAMNLKLKDKINTNLKAAYAEPDIVANTDEEFDDLFAPFSNDEIPASSTKKKMRFIDAIQDGLRESMRKHDRLVLMGQDIAEYGGVFKVTEGFVEEFGKGRVRNTPLCESAIVGAGLGLSMKGHKAMVEMQFADFVTCGFNQIVNNLAKLHYRWAENADVVVRMPTGGGAAAGPFHSQSNEAWFFHTPGLKIAYPAFPSDAKGLLCQAFEDPNPVLFFEHKMLYRSIEEEVSEGHFALPFGKARIVSAGDKLTLVTYGLGVHWGLEVLKEEKYAGIELIDLRTLAPLDYETVMTSVQKTGRVVVLHEDSLTGGIGGELASRITEECFEYLDAPVTRCASLDTPIPFNAGLEINFMANNRLRTTLDKVLSY
ncbi:MAG: dehydrogenase E1 component subunit alpha/beta [Flavobacteriales bacterium]|nr:dehydrogenase E1 component subunit alpha/beta [Flavobacteriales bacterium]MDP4717960.1 dehydrogenase E1 component subunit alpha/beta [Flavobacteriales bacterium]MDP4732078.1 dehydrogenase E1 component subunit alpha/beta [Flavobacteriales bacterium]MDP4817403.1 dehydrogenase E1 component subunit alpha/beta [Flavobacteriales bacterium]MDP4950569.1 dehydrogenase E1 component subunit alpha/beta [Flavobacteriales bacterium]